MSSKSLQRMAAPLVVSFTLRFLFTLVDMAYAAVLDDDNAAVAAIGFYAPVQSLFIAVWVGLSAGFTASLSSAFGHRDEGRVAALKRAMLRILGRLIPVLVGLGVIAWVTIPHLPLQPGLRTAFRTYATTLMIGMPLTGFWSIWPDSIVKAHHDTRSTMIAGLASTVANVTLNTAFVFVFHWGIFGIALSTVVSRFAGLGYALHRARALERHRTAEGAWTGYAPGLAPARAILALAVPGALTHLLQASEGVAVNSVLQSLPGRLQTDAIASWAVYERMLQLALMPAAATSVAVVPYVALLLPRGELLRIRREMTQTLLLTVAVALGLTTLMGWVFAAPLAGFFVGRGAADGAAGVTPLTLDALRLLPLGALAATPFLILRPTFEAAHRPRAGIVLSVARYLGLSIPLLVLGFHVAPVLGLPSLHGMILGIVVGTLLAALAAAVLARRLLAEPAHAGSEPAEAG